MAELDDKTQLAVITQTRKYRRPWAVFVSASAAVVAVTALGAMGGHVLRRLIPDDPLCVATALWFMVIDLLVAREAARGVDGTWRQNCSASICKNLGDHRTGGASISEWNGHTFGAILLLLFLAE